MGHRRLSKERYALLPLVLAALVAAVAAPAASAAPDKPYAVTLTPAVPAGDDAPGFTFEIKNLTKTQQLGSADVNVPAVFPIVSAPTVDRGRVTPVGNRLELRDLALPPNAAVTMTVPLRVPCVAGPVPYEWTILAKQSNDFSGPPGNSMGPVQGSLVTTVTSACALRFVTQPASTEKNQDIRAVRFAPESNEVVSVEAIDGSATPERLTWLNGPVTMGLAPSPYLGRLVGTSGTLMSGLATFLGLQIDVAGVYNLRATKTAFVGAQSAPAFTVVDVAEPCDSVKCTAKLAGRQGSLSTLTGGTGTSTGVAVLSLNLGLEPTCDGYSPPTADWFEFEVTAARDKTIALAYDKLAMKAFGKGKEALEICFAAPQGFPFPVKGGGPAQAFDYDSNPDNGAEGFVGLLPDCMDFSSPCITGRDSIGSDGAQISFFVPAAWGDPRFH